MALKGTVSAPPTAPLPQRRGPPHTQTDSCNTATCFGFQASGTADRGNSAAPWPSCEPRQEPPCSPADTPNTPPRDQQTSPRQFQTWSTHFVRLLQIDGKRIEKRDLFSQPFSKCIGAWTRRGRISSLRRSFDLKVVSLDTGHFFSFLVERVSWGHFFRSGMGGGTLSSSRALK